MSKCSLTYRQDGSVLSEITIVAGDIFPPWVLEDCFNTYTRPGVEFLEIKCLALDKGKGTLSLEVRYQLPGNPPQEILQPRLDVDGLQGYFTSYKHQKIAKKIARTLQLLGPQPQPQPQPQQQQQRQQPQQPQQQPPQPQQQPQQ